MNNKNLIEIPVLVVRRPIGIQGRILVKRTVRGVLRPVAGKLDGISEQQAFIGIGQRGVGIQRIPLRCFHDAGRIVVRQPELVAHPFIAPFQRQRMLVAESHAQRLGKPVGIHPALYIIIYFFVRFHRRDDSRGCVRTVHPDADLEIQFLLGIHQVVTGQIRSLDTEIARVIHPQFAHLRTHRLDDHHPVTGLGTVNRFSSGIFQ